TRRSFGHGTIARGAGPGSRTHSPDAAGTAACPSGRIRKTASAWRVEAAAFWSSCLYPIALVKDLNIPNDLKILHRKRQYRCTPVSECPRERRPEPFSKGRRADDVCLIVR